MMGTEALFLPVGNERTIFFFSLGIGKTPLSLVLNQWEKFPCSIISNEIPGFFFFFFLHCHLNRNLSASLLCAWSNKVQTGIIQHCVLMLCPESNTLLWKGPLLILFSCPGAMYRGSNSPICMLLLHHPYSEN